ncbi:MAG: hypothetical protein AAGB22_03030 [Bacteroidota bacterium]
MLWLVPGTLAAQEEAFDTTRYSNGMVRATGEMVDGQPHGRWGFFDRDGNLRSTKEYEYGHLLKKVLYHPSGVKSSQVHYLRTKQPRAKEPIKDGRMTKWNKRGKVILQVTYVNNQMHGPVFEWHDNLRQKLEANYDNGTPVGDWTEWFSNGKLRSQGTFDAEGNRIGFWTFNGISGLPLLEMDFANVEANEGIWTTYYHRNGRKKKEGLFGYQGKNTLSATTRYILWKSQRYSSQGKWSYWDQNGKLIRELFYDRGKVIAVEEFTR